MDLDQLLRFTNNYLLDGLRMGITLGALTGAVVWPFFGASERVIVRMAVGFFGGLMVAGIFRGPVFFEALAVAYQEAPPDVALGSIPGFGPAFITFLIDLAVGIAIGTFLMIMIADPPRFVMGGLYGALTGMFIATLLRYGLANIPMAPTAFFIVVVIAIAGALSVVAVDRA